MSDSALRLLHGLSWNAEAPPKALQSWLLEAGSMTSRLERYCHKITVEPQREEFIMAIELGSERDLVPEESRYWLREIVLFGDGEPWLAGRTLAPESTFIGAGAFLSKLGEEPLGKVLFSGIEMTRDFIESGRSGELWGRRSRLRLSGKPLLLTELFLPASPVYSSSFAGGEP